jgi:hypothetical protein
MEYLDDRFTDFEIRIKYPALMRSSGEFDAKRTRARLAGQVAFQPESVMRYQFKPFDWRYAYLSPDIAPLFSRPNPALLTTTTIRHNKYFVCRQLPSKSPEGFPCLFSSKISDYDALSGHARHIPMYVSTLDDEGLFRRSSGPNVSGKGISYLDGLRCGIDRASLWFHVLSICFSKTYLTSHLDALRQDWPRIPLPKSAGLLVTSVKLGKQVAALLDASDPVDGVTAGLIRSELKSIGPIRRASGEGLDEGDLQVTAGWGHAGQNGITMPGRGRRTERPFTGIERSTFDNGLRTLGMDRTQILSCLGPGTGDVWLNDVAYWSNIPEQVWEFTIGGYQVMKKWLSYREYDLLGRALTAEEAREVTAMARRLAALCLMQPALDANYEAVIADTYAWPSG